MVKIRNLILFIVTCFLLHSLANAAPACHNLFSKPFDFKERIQSTLEPSHLDLSEILFHFAQDGKLIYRGKHKFQAGTEFLASNEFDWLSTPFDHKPADVLVAFGTNSAWEIAINKNVKSLYIGDWSPYPLLAHAYIVEPLIKIAKTPKEFIVLLSGRIPIKKLTELSLDEVFNQSTLYAKSNNGKNLETKRFLRFLARQRDISDFELKFLVSYFYGLAAQNNNPKSLGPFQNLQYSSYAKLLNFYDQRYSPSVVTALNEQTKPTVKLEQVSAFSRQENFDKLRQLFINNQVHYGLTSIMDMKFYQKIQARELLYGRTKYALSITNIFDCGDYNGLTNKDFQNFLLETMNIFKANSTNPLTVFRTTNVQPPHGFYRYDLTKKTQIPSLVGLNATAL